MAVLQSKIDEIRYLRRQNLEEEAKIVGNYYRDLIRQYGVDVNYYKLKTPYLNVFKKIIDDNTLIMHAYGEDPNPDYSVSSDMISYMEVENDMFQLNKYGVLPNTDVNFYFDSTDFACQLAWKLGQLKEYPIEEQEFFLQVPEVLTDYVEYDYNDNGEIEDGEIEYLSSYQWPYKIGYGVPQYFKCSILSGKFAVRIGPYTLSNDESPEYTEMCRVYEHGDVDISFPVNDSIYQSFNHTIGNKEYVDNMLFLTYRVRRIKTYSGIKYVLHGKLHGSVLFHDLNVVGKYLDKIHPDVGDIVTIDFPDESNRQQFEITECVDKQLGNDGINPLLHKYIWKCKARRYINSGEDFGEKNEGNERWVEKIDFINKADEDIAKQISNYDDTNSDGKYGGYERTDESYDKEIVDKDNYSRMEFIDDGSFINIFTFKDNTKLVTDGYELYFVDSQNYRYMLSMNEKEHIINQNLVASDLQYLKSTDDALFFVDFEGGVCKLCEDEEITQGEIQSCLNSLVEATYDRKNNNNDGDCYYKFRESNTVLISVNDHLYCRFGNKNGKMVKMTFKCEEN